MPKREIDLKKILYIEDDIGLARLLQKKMESIGYEVTIAYDAETGLQEIKNQTFSMILLDNQLPGISGLELMNIIYAMPSYPPVIILTSDGDEAVAVDALEKGAADYMVKDSGQYYLQLLPAVMKAAYVKDRLARENAQQQKELELAKEKAEAANKAKSEFLTTMSHEIRTPMNAVVGLATLLEHTNLDAKQKEMVETLHSNATLLLKLINDLLDLSRIETGHIELDEEEVRLTDILKDIESMFMLQAKQKNLEFIIRDNTKGQTFLADRTRLQQIIMNLVGNAIKFTETGTVEINANFSLNADANRAEAIVTVSDTGIGIPDPKKVTIFEKFVQADQSITRKYGGSGLGLAISKRLSELMFGDITVESVEGKGSIFTARWNLPISKNSGKPEAVKPQNDYKKSGGKVLLVEDYPANIMVASMMLENMGYSVDTAICGNDALKLVANRETPYDAILMDVQMNDMDGYETTRKIRSIEESRGYRHRIIGVTAHALSGDRERCIESGMDDYMSKPINPNTLAKMMKAA